jgi:Histidine kinase-, DNA gyrase B-, and HSP90-like ATPase
VAAIDRERIFAPFTQLDASTTRRVGGVGLGLFLVDRLVRGMGGRVWVEDNQGGGARFVVELPDLAPVGSPLGREPPGRSGRPKTMDLARLLRGAAGLLLAGLLVAACAAPDGDDGGPAQGGATAPTTPPTRVARPIAPAGQVTVVGMVTEGVEANCLLLDTGSGTRYLLVGGERAELRTGARVAVTGRVDRGLLSTCQQGEPLVVASIEPAP